MEGKWQCDSNCLNLTTNDIKTVQTVTEFCVRSTFECLKCGKKAFHFFEGRQVLAAVGMDPATIEKFCGKPNATSQSDARTV